MTRTHLIDCQETGRHPTRYVLTYTASEMDEVFTATEREMLAAGNTITKNTCRYVDLQAFYDAHD
ncbi:MAG: hypothetical protein WBA42_07100 [Mesorhizobium sp.]